jgi:IS30 family transposase
MLMLLDREEISRGLAEDLTFAQIAVRIGRDPSVVSREVARHGGRQEYRAAVADERACAARARPKRLAVDRSPRLREIVCRQLRGGWSPASVAGRLSIDYPHDQACRVSHEAIYQWATPSRCLPWPGS